MSILRPSGSTDPYPTETMRKFIFLAALILLTTTLSAQQGPQSPQVFFGFEPGADRELFGYDRLTEYLMQLDRSSERVLMKEIGSSPMGKPIYICFISSSSNIAALDSLREVNRRLALDPDIPPGRLEEIVATGKVFVLATLSMHSSEVGPSQSAPLIAYDLATTGEMEKLQWLDDVVYMMVPCHNPDGMDMIVDNYKKHRGTTYEGASLPRVYHQYVGHDNNRDFVILTQEDNRAIARIYNQTWFPQVMVEKHQMGSTGTRYFVPPNHDPIAENVPAGIFHWSGVFGQHMATDMTAQGLAGISQHYLFDDYWPGSTETCIWKNVIGFLTEAASVHTASPIYIEPGELTVHGKGLSEYKKSINMLLPWEGGWWRLGDIVEYEVASTRSILRTASRFRGEILEFRNRMCREQVALGREEAPFYYIMPDKQHDPGELVDLVRLMKEHGVEVFVLEEQVEIDGRIHREGDVVIPLAQPFRAFIKEVMETQEFPERHYTPGGELIKPYDITSWSLPLHRHVTSYEIDVRSPDLEEHLEPVTGTYTRYQPVDQEAHALVLPVSSNASFRAAFRAMESGLRVERLTSELSSGGLKAGEGSFVVYRDPRKTEEWEALEAEMTIPVIPVSGESALETEPAALPRIALVETYFHDMDAGWTRYLFDTYHVGYEVLRPHQLKEKDLAGEFDVVIFPDTDKSVLMTGKRKSGDDYYMGSYHPDYVKGIEKEGMEKLMTFIDRGGIVLAWGRSARLFEGILKIKREGEEEEFQLPFRDISPSLAQSGLFVPGSLVRVKVTPSHPLTLGMPEETGVFSRGRPVFRTSVPMFDMDRRVIGSYPEKEILMSGYSDKEEQMGNRAAMVWMKKGKGQFVLYGFNPQFRASTQASYKLLFNALLLPRI